MHGRSDRPMGSAKRGRLRRMEETGQVAVIARRVHPARSRRGALEIVMAAQNGVRGDRTARRAS